MEELFKEMEKSLTFQTQIDRDRRFLLNLYSQTREEELSYSNFSSFEKKKFLESQFNLRETFYIEKFSSAEFLIIYRKKRAIGRVVFFKDSNNLHIVDIAFIKKARGLGYGTLILNRIFKHSKIVTLSVAIDNFRALKLYEKLGFKVVEQDGFYYKLKRES